MDSEVHLCVRRGPFEGYDVRPRTAPTLLILIICSQFVSWGQSAGSVSVALHMLANDGDPEGLFRAGFLESGTPGPYGDILELQGTYDQIVSDAGCASSDDTLHCLRTVPIEALSAAMDKSPSFVDYVVRIATGASQGKQMTKNNALVASEYAVERSCGWCFRNEAPTTLAIN